jgi:branched-chain amino acid transport system ATP-binding protein
MLVVDDIHTYYGDSYVLQGLSLRVEKGQIVAIIGRNGMGKTTLVRSVMGLTPPRRGTIEFQGVRISGLSPYQINRLGIGIVPQGRRIFSSLSVAEHLRLAFRRRKAVIWTVDRILELFVPLQRLMSVRAGKLSGGEQQMLANGRALAGNPNLILMDEPTEGLAPIRARELARILLDLRNKGISILLVEQNLRFVMAVADLVHVLDKGVLVFAGTPADFQGNQDVRRYYLHLR